MKNNKDKAGNLQTAAEAGFNVPPFQVVDISEILAINGQIDKILENCTEINAESISQKISKIIKAATIPAINFKIDPDKKYAVRSSGSDEDSQSFSFAGQYKSYLNVSGADEIKNRILDCCASQYSTQNLVYRLNNGLPLLNKKMRVIVQEMLNPDISGVAFSINVLTGNDTQIMYETCFGLGENSVDGKNRVSSYIYDWYNEKEIKADEPEVRLNRSQKDKICQAVLDLQCHFGYPVDVEFAFENDKLYILQVRPITKILFEGLNSQFTTANFRDGGVSARPCNTLLWSIYQNVWHDTFAEFFIKTKTLKPKKNQRLIKMFFATPYWDVGACKLASAKLPGFVEKDFDTDLGIKINYAGQGVKTKITPKFILRLPFILKAVFKTLKNNERNLEKNKQHFTDTYNRFASVNIDTLTLKEVETLFKQVLTDGYYKNENNYFGQIFINTIRLSMYRRSAQKIIGGDEYINLLSNIADISHLRIYKAAEKFAKEIKADKSAHEFWVDNTTEQIADAYLSNKNQYRLILIDEFNKQYGYHSFRELDLTYPDYYENPIYAITLIKESLDKTPVTSSQLPNQYKTQCALLEQRLTPRKYKKLMRLTQNMHKFLWWREEFKDLCTRYYSLIRKITLRLASDYAAKGILNNTEQIFDLSYTDIFDYLDGKINKEQLRKTALKNHKYYLSFVNFNPIGEIGGSPKTDYKKQKESLLKGVGCGGSKAVGVVRIINEPCDLELIKSGEIIVSKHFDAGFTGKFGVISGIITQTGGVLCHSSIIAREYSLPAIVSADGLSLLKTGDIIEMDASNGNISIIKNK